MDLSNRNAQPQAASHASPSTGGAGRSSKNDKDKLGRIGFVAAIAAVVILLLGVILFATKGGDANESKFVDSSKLQAVFLNTGQVYFGNVKTLNNKYFVLTNIYYLQTSGNGQQNSNTSVSLVKLGCELHEPYDKMVINRDQVTFWENLQDNGQVAQAVKTFVKQNPNGQKCADQSNSANTSSTNSAQPANNGSTTGTTNKSTTTTP